MKIEDRFEINAAIERLVAEGTVFDPADAALLIDKVPLTGAGGVEFRFDDEKPQTGLEGFAAGVGRFRDEKSGRSTKRVSTVPEPVRVGGYKIWHRAGGIVIELMWADTDLEKDGRRRDGTSIILEYNRRTRTAKALRISRLLPIELVFWPKPRISFRLELMTFVTWKKPGTPGGTTSAPYSAPAISLAPTRRMDGFKATALA